MAALSDLRQLLRLPAVSHLDDALQTFLHRTETWPPSSGYTVISKITDFIGLYATRKARGCSVPVKAQSANEHSSDRV